MGSPFSDLRWEGALAQVSLAGVRPLVQATISVDASSGDSYEIQDGSAKRVVLYHGSTGAEDIHVNLGASAVATDMPIAPGAYFVMRVEKGESVAVYNAKSGGPAVIVYIMEIR
jgi:hypothetical protein